MEQKETTKRKSNNNRLFHVFIKNYGARTLIATLVGTVVNVAMAVFNGVEAGIYSSLWYSAFAGYYMILAMQKLSLLIAYKIYDKKYSDNPEELYKAKLKAYLANGTIFILLDIALIVIAFVMLSNGKPVQSDMILAIASAVYAFYKIIGACIQLVKATAERDPLIQTIRNIGVVEATVSMLALETTLISTFGNLSGNLLILLFVSSIVVAVFVLGFAVFMIVRGALKLKKIKKSKAEQG